MPSSIFTRFQQGLSYPQHDSDEISYQAWAGPFLDWCESSYLLLHAKKTKEVMFDFSSMSNTHHKL